METMQKLLPTMSMRKGELSTSPISMMDSKLLSTDLIIKMARGVNGNQFQQVKIQEYHLNMDWK